MSSPNSSQQFFEAGREQLEEEIKQLVVQKTSPEELLQIEGIDIKGDSLQKIKTWCINSEGNILLKTSSDLQVEPETPHLVIPPCRQLD